MAAAKKLDKRSKIEITREEINSKLEYDVVEKTVVINGNEFKFPVKVYKDPPRLQEALGVKSTASYK